MSVWVARSQNGHCSTATRSPNFCRDCIKERISHASFTTYLMRVWTPLLRTSPRYSLNNTHTAHLLGVGCAQGATDAEATGFDACSPKCVSTIHSFRLLTSTHPVPMLSGPVLVRIQAGSVFKCFHKCKALIQIPLRSHSQRACSS